MWRNGDPKRYQEAFNNTTKKSFQAGIASSMFEKRENSVAATRLGSDDVPTVEW